MKQPGVKLLVATMLLLAVPAAGGQDCSDCGTRNLARVGAFPARPDLPGLFLQEAARQLDHMELHGWTARARDGRLVSAKDLRALLARIRVKELDVFRKPLGASRFTAFYESSSGTIYLNGRAATFDHRRDLLGALALHEIFGLAGVEDEKYQRSALLLVSSRLEGLRGVTEDQRLRFRSAMSHFLVQADKGNEVLLSERGANMVLASGGTRVGGGGDEGGLELKAALIEEALSRKVSVELLVQSAEVEVEVSESLARPVLQQANGARTVGAVLVPRSPDARALAREVLASPLWTEGFAQPGRNP